MKIVVLGTRGFPHVQGGIETHCENLYPRIAARGCEVVVFARKPYVSYRESHFWDVKLISLSCPKQKTLEAFVHTLKGLFYARRLKPDILHFHAIGPSLLIPLARLMGFKIVMTHHGPDYRRKKWGVMARIFLKTGEYFGCKFSNEVIVISDVIAADILKKYGRKAIVIPNGVIPPEISTNDEMVKKFGLTKGKYILSVGRFVPEKGFHDLMGAFVKFQAENLEPKYKEWKLVIVGRADHEDDYSKKLREKARGNRNVILPGYLDHLPLAELYSYAGLFVLPSYHEGLPIALLEAMSYGISCVVSDIPANREVGLQEDRFFKAGDIQQLAKKIIEFISKPLSVEEKSRQISLISEKYDWGRIAEKTLEVYKRVR
jgi:glycosyltransferase involved in cell wall biosynthesis